MNKSDLLDKVKALLNRMRDHETPDHITSKKELGPLLRDAEELLETVSILKYLIDDEDNINEEASLPAEVEILSSENPVENDNDPDPKTTGVETEKYESTSEEKESGQEKVEEPIIERAPFTSKEVAVEDENDNQTTINEAIAPNQDQTRVGDKLEQDGVKNLVNAIGINERFLYINELFDGDSDGYERAINHLNSFSHLREAMEFLRAEVSDKYNWDQEQESTITFYALIEKRFAN